MTMRGHTRRRGRGQSRRRPGGARSAAVSSVGLADLLDELPSLGIIKNSKKLDGVPLVRSRVAREPHDGARARAQRTRLKSQIVSFYGAVLLAVDGEAARLRALYPATDHRRAELLGVLGVGGRRHVDAAQAPRAGEHHFD